ncbi:patatin-like phospholipase family protein (plasmid) [Rhizobium sp. CB3171]|uniref:patatin-like phospholipase family protein n=1 Tax=Rhizobium sp. CB3171 TaxID=3039157 RepID=UPI0024B182B4|nr:patatin-like phospholipase family protein [Rhizobium sp. CB3171]WFU04534.1 patatin-like phospholipase family protein [Rhizobium sp. CB3171]
MNELGLLSKAQCIASVSGGSLAAGILATQWALYGNPDGMGVLPSFREIFLPKVLTFAQSHLDVMDIAAGILPFTTAAIQISRSYEQLLFGNLTLRDLPSSPEFVFCSTNLSTGVLFRFTRKYAGDYILGYIPDPQIKLSTAVAASAAFPPFLSPVVLDVTESDFEDWPDDVEQIGVDVAAFRRRIVLCDGGVYDNHGIEPIAKRFTTNFVSDGGAPFARVPIEHVDWLSQLRRIADVEDSQVRALRRRALIESFRVGNAVVENGTISVEQLDRGARLGAYWGIDTDQSKIGLSDGLLVDPVVASSLAAVSTRLSNPGDDIAKGLVNWGYAIADRSIRAHYKGPQITNGPPPAFPI